MTDAVRWTKDNWDQIAALLPQDRTPILGISGAQGSGKSWLAEDIASRFDGRVAALSLDDFYLTKAQRQELAKAIHPNLAIRGVPGTHDIALLRRTLRTLKSGGARWPRFDKIADDRLPHTQWCSLSEAPDLILLEGWCVGAQPQNADALATPLNAFERRTDEAGVWRTYVNDKLCGAYRAVFSQLDAVLFLRAPSFDCVLEWRWQQEQTTYERAQRSLPPNARRDIEAFILPFERLSRHMLSEGFADMTLQLNTRRDVVDVR